MFKHQPRTIPNKPESVCLSSTHIVKLRAFIFIGLIGSVLLFLITTPVNSFAQEGPRRFKLLNADELTPEQVKLAESIKSGPRSSTGSTSTAANQPLGSPFNVWLRSPEMGDIIQKLGSQIRFNSSLPPRLNEFAILITAQHWGSKYEWFAHYRLAIKGGLNSAIADQLLANKRPEGMSLDEAAVYDFSTELRNTHFVSDAVYQRALDLFGERGVVDLIAVNGYYDLVSMTLNVDRTPVPSTTETQNSSYSPKR